jgi:guanosine-3',5'-bis(diphosphate) 3'-pyrophosphohydrolase
VTAVEDGTEEVLSFLSGAYGQRSLEHPLAVARLLREARQPHRIVVAGLLHDVLEDTKVTADEVRRRFGGPVSELVEALTEDGGIDDVRQRKAALRRQILDAGPSAATIALADKAAKLSEPRLNMNSRRLEHYRSTLEGVEQRYGHSRLSELLRRRLAAYDG